MKNLILYLPFFLMIFNIQSQSIYAQAGVNENITASQKLTSEQAIISLAQLINERLSYMKDVAAYKWVNQLAIEDLEREQVVLQNSMQSAKTYQLDSLSTRQFFEQQIFLAKEVQQYWFDQWEQHSFENYTYADLDLVVRPVLTTLGNKILKATHALAPWNFPESTLNKGRLLFIKELTTKGITPDEKHRLFKAITEIKPLRISKAALKKVDGNKQP